MVGNLGRSTRVTRTIEGYGFSKQPIGRHMSQPVAMREAQSTGTLRKGGRGAVPKIAKEQEQGGRIGGGYPQRILWKNSTCRDQEALQDRPRRMC